MPGHLAVESDFDSAVIVPISGIQCDESAAGFDQTPRDQGLFAPSISVPAPSFLVFFGNIKRVARASRQENVERLLIDIIHLFERRVMIESLAERIELLL